MTLDVRPCRSHEELARALDAIGHYFGSQNTVEDAERFANWVEVERMHAAWEDGRIVGGAGAFSYDLSVPGGATVRSGGVTVVGVQPTHRRRGVLRAMMRAQLDDIRARGEPVSWLWASEAPIYTRFGYGLASLIGDIELARVVGDAEARRRRRAATAGSRAPEPRAPRGRRSPCRLCALPGRVGVRAR